MMLEKLLNREHDFPILGKLKIGDRIKDDWDKEGVVVGFVDNSFDVFETWRIFGCPSIVKVKLTDGTLCGRPYLHLNKRLSLLSDSDKKVKE